MNLGIFLRGTIGSNLSELAANLRQEWLYRRYFQSYAGTEALVDDCLMEGAFTSA